MVLVCCVMPTSVAPPCEANARKTPSRLPHTRLGTEYSQVSSATSRLGVPPQVLTVDAVVTLSHQRFRASLPLFAGVDVFAADFLGDVAEDVRYYLGVEVGVVLRDVVKRAEFYCALANCDMADAMAASRSADAIWYLIAIAGVAWPIRAISSFCVAPAMAAQVAPT